jgi:hypothetical protein
MALPGCPPEAADPAGDAPAHGQAGLRDQVAAALAMLGSSQLLEAGGGRGGGAGGAPDAGDAGGADTESDEFRIKCAPRGAGARGRAQSARRRPAPPPSARPGRGGRRRAAARARGAAGAADRGRRSRRWRAPQPPPPACPPARPAASTRLRPAVAAAPTTGEARGARGQRHPCIWRTQRAQWRGRPRRTPGLPRRGDDPPARRP